MARKEKKQLPLALACVLDQGRVLLIRRYEPNIPSLHGKWELPGGKVEFGEDPAHTAEREVHEETGNLVMAESMVPFPYVAVRRYKERDLHSLILCYRCTYRGCSPDWIKPQKVQDVAWVSIDELDPLQIQSGSLQFLRYVLRTEGYLTAIGRTSSLEFVTLQSVDKKANRLRGYEITVESKLSENESFRIACSWGRLPRYGKGSVQSFEKRDDALSYLSRVLKTRARHRYSVVAKSDKFPDLPELQLLAHSEPFREQLELFR